MIIGHNIGTTCVERMCLDERMLYSIRKKMGENVPSLRYMDVSGVFFFTHATPIAREEQVK